MPPYSYELFCLIHSRKIQLFESNIWRSANCGHMIRCAGNNSHSDVEVTILIQVWKKTALACFWRTKWQTAATRWWRFFRLHMHESVWAVNVLEWFLKMPVIFCSTVFFLSAGTLAKNLGIPYLLGSHFFFVANWKKVRGKENLEWKKKQKKKTAVASNRDSRTSN